MWNIGLELAALVVVGYGLTNYLGRDKIRYDRSRDYEYSLEADWSCGCKLAAGTLEPQSAPPAEHTLLLAARVASGPLGRLFDPRIEVVSAQGIRVHHFEPGAGGLRYVDLTPFAADLVEGRPVRIRARHCRIEPVELLAYARPPLDNMRLMIIAPHPDDAEIAAYGMYEEHAARTSIVTVSAGENLQALKRQYIPGLDEALPEAIMRKGQIRAWDAHCVPRWAGVRPDDTVMLGYPNGALKRMRKEPDQAVGHRIASSLRPDDFRRFNTIALPSDGKATNRWSALVDDLSALIDMKRPDAIVTPHPEIDAHADHVASTQAVEEAMGRSSHQVSHILYYANHIRGTRNHPYGPEHGIAGLPPHFSALEPGQRALSIPLDAERQRRKACALYLMHDLVSPVRPMKHLRRQWRHFLRWGRLGNYGPDTYFRTAVRANELFLYRSRIPPEREGSSG